MKYNCMVEGDGGRNSRLSQIIIADNQEQARSLAQKWCASLGKEYDIIELILA